MKIGIYGGSFDPVHNGHTNLINNILDSSLKLDKLIIVPTLISPFKQDKRITSKLHRIKMLELALPKNCEISDFEIKKKPFVVSYTIDTIMHFKKIYPNDELFLILGNENKKVFHKWKEFLKISSLLEKIVFVPRVKETSEDIGKYKKNVFKFIKDKVLELEFNILDVSSTEIRMGKKLDQLNPEVLNYISNNFLYAENIINSTLSAKRAKHCFFAAKFAAELAKTINYDAKIAYYAGLFHDICKEWTEEESRTFIKNTESKYQKEWNSIPKHKLHQICGALWLKNVYKLKNEEIIQAIEIHTTLNLKLSTLDKIVFIADKICQGRNYPGIQKIRKLALTNFDKGFAEVVKMNYNHQIEKGKILEDEQIKINEKWINS